MSVSTLGLPDALRAYILEVSVREHPGLAAIRAASDQLPEARMRSSTEQVQLLMLLIKLIEARRVLEVGVFTGYATLGFALAVPDFGKVLALDLTDEWLGEARKQWARAGVADRIEVKLGPAVETLDGLVASGARESVDLAFIDADKVNYPSYFERCLTLVRPNGLIAIDNVLWSGKVADPSVDDPDTVALRSLNMALKDDDRVDLSLVPIGDGLTLARKR